MDVTVDLPAEALRRLRAEAVRRGVSIDDVIAELAAQLPDGRSEGRHRLSFIGIGASGRIEPLDIRCERADLLERNLVEGI